MVAWFFGLSLVFLVVTLLRPFRVNTGILFCRILTPVALRIMGVKLIIRNRERLDSNRPFVLIGNHQSIFDVFFYGSLIPENTVTIGKKSLRWIPLFGWMYYLSGHLLIDRGQRERAAETMAEATDYLIKDSLSVLIFPEGTRSRGQGLGPFKKGAFYLAINTGFALQPVALSSYYRRLNFWRWHAGTVIAEVLEPIQARGKTREDLPQLMETAHQSIARAIAQLDKEPVSE